MVDDTKARILRAALEAFAKDGYHKTSIQRLAGDVGISKAAVLYHFATKADVLAELARPMLDALVAAIDAAERAKDVRFATLENVADVFLAHRYLLRMNLADLGLVESGVFARWRDQMLRANELVAGKHPSLEERVLAAQALATLGDPIVLYADAPLERLRAAVLEGPRRLFRAPMAERRGRPKSLGTREIERARSLHARGASPHEVSKILGVSRATIYRYLRQ